MVNLVPFLTYVFVICFTPGPNNIVAISTANKYGLMQAVKFNIGAAFGFGAVVLISSLTNLILSKQIEDYRILFSIIGCSYIFYLAYVLIKSGTHFKDEKNDVKTYSYFSGIIMQFINPKGILAAITLGNLFIIPNVKNNFDIALFVLFLTFMAFISGFCWSLCGSFFRKIIYEYQKPIDIVMAGLLVYCGIAIF